MTTNRSEYLPPKNIAGASYSVANMYSVPSCGDMETVLRNEGVVSVHTGIRFNTVLVVDIL